MKNFTTRDRLISLSFFILIWTLGAYAIGEGLILPSPLQVFFSFLSLLGKSSTYTIVLSSTLKILLAFSLAIIIGLVLSLLALYSKTIEAILVPFILIFKSVPVAAFTILALLWIGVEGLSFFIVFIVIIPIIYTNALGGMRSADYRLLEMAEVHNLSFIKRVKYIYFPAMEGEIGSALALSIGIAFKSGIAAEVIGRPAGTIGESLIKSKIYLETGDLFAWVIIILLVSFFFERLVAILYKRLII
ncbi:MAG: ABC transporter permease subunit [Tissierellia bacterium]|nr:ABC transporter permease subunit [Tissierellia bacterium]